jgi:antibiotic biosynthesis monooxygenase (ABM) superfamily enzyme
MSPKQPRGLAAWQWALLTLAVLVAVVLLLTYTLQPA